ncbi:calcium/sodium antiporter [Oleispirillum naphthae]|uniref:calcium/sodium antiporter n=1 Tax=Oleispirillum naphthae TaxID=2838853 RepID=UPI0030823208
MVLLKLGVGLVLLLVAGDLLVRGAVVLARRAGISPLVIGLTLVGFGTSLPELLASLQAALIGAPGIAVGNVVGSNVANILLILGTAALMFPVSCEAPGIRRDLGVLAFATLAAIALLHWGQVPRSVGASLVAALLLYTGTAIFFDRREYATVRLREEESRLADAMPPVRLGIAGALLLTIAAMAGVVVGARFLVESSVILALRWGVSESLIGVTVVAVGTSLPELATSVVAAIKRESDVALGNVIGSNIFNILGILGVTSAVSPIVVPAEISGRDTWVLALVTFALIGVVLGLKHIPRALGFTFLVAYGVYITGLAGGLPDLPVDLPIDLPSLPSLPLPSF